MAEIPERHVESDRYIPIWGAQYYVIPAVQDWPRTVIAINLGGALIPTILSIYLDLSNTAILSFSQRDRHRHRSLPSLHQFAQLVHGLGISVPIYIPPIAAVLTAIVLSWSKAAPLGYIVGSLGTLIGADILNLGQVANLGAPIASIGGAGTFDGVFLAGILAVLLAPTVSQTIGKTTWRCCDRAKPRIA